MKSMEPRPLLFGLPDAKRRLIGRLLLGGMVLLMAGGIAVGFGPFFFAARTEATLTALAGAVVATATASLKTGAVVSRMMSS